MAKRKIKCKKDKVSCRSLCEKLPRDLFSDTEYVWWHDTEWHKWYVTSRALLERAWGWKPSECVPAPTVDELFEKFPAITTGELRIIPTYHSLFHRWEVCARCPTWNSEVNAKGRTFVSAVCNLYLSLKKEFERGKKCIKHSF